MKYMDWWKIREKTATDKNVILGSLADMSVTEHVDERAGDEDDNAQDTHDDLHGVGKTQLDWDWEIN